MLNLDWDMEIPLFDTHGHIDLLDYDLDRKQVLERYFSNKKNLFINVGIDYQTCLNTVLLTKRYKNLYGSVGLHPHGSSLFEGVWKDFLEKWTKEEKIIAIGEIGLDFFRNYAPVNKQKEAFNKQLDWAIDWNLPVIIHCRDAGDDMASILKEKPHWGILHCFQGEQKLLDVGLEQDYFISFAGNLTYKKTNLPKVLKQIPLKRLLVETDCPYLTPTPFRGKRNDPFAVSLVVKMVSEILDMELTETAKLLFSNAKVFLEKTIKAKSKRN